MMDAVEDAAKAHFAVRSGWGLGMRRCEWGRALIELCGCKAAGVRGRNRSRTAAFDWGR